MPPKADIEILAQIIDDERGLYRLRVGQRVHYLTIPVGVFDDDTMCRPYLLIPRLPDLPDLPWTTMTITRDNNDGSLTSTISTDPLREIKTTWHEVSIDVLSLKRMWRLRSGVHEVQYNGAPAIAKVANFEWQIAQIERETWAYSWLADYAHEQPDEPPIAPKFLGHLTENGRTMGFLLEKLDGEEAGIADLADCEALLDRLHNDVGLVHGDVNRYNFVIDRVSGGGVRLVDFEHAQEFDEELARTELMSLPAALTEETGRGGCRMYNEN